MHWAGFAALGLGAATAVLCVDTDPYTGPVARATGLDLSLPVGMTVAAAVYAVLFRRHGSAG